MGTSGDLSNERTILVYSHKLQATREDTISVPRETLEGWREALLTIEITNEPGREDSLDEVRELVDAMDALLSTDAEKGAGSESDD